MPKKTWQPKAAGILMIIDGVIFMLTVLLLLLLGELYTNPHYLPGQEPSQSELQMQFIRKPLTGLIGIFPIVSGVFCLKRRFWGFAIAGATLAMVPLVPIWWYFFFLRSHNYLPHTLFLPWLPLS
jgi:hypothetical protein